MLAAALTQAHDARLAILDVMAEAIDAPEEMTLYAPRIITIKIPVDKIGEVIGPKGKVINQIQDDTGAQHLDRGRRHDLRRRDQRRDGRGRPRRSINAIANPTMPEIGERYLGTVVKTTNFGAFVSLLPGKDGLLHISKLRPLAGGKRVENVEDVVSVGQKIQVEIAEIDDRGKLSLIPVVEEPARSGSDDRLRSLQSDVLSSAAQQKPGTTRTLLSRRGRRALVRRTVLPAGCGWSPSTMPGVRSARIGVFVGVGSRDETDAAARRLALPRAPAVQGHPDAVARWRSRSALDAVGGEFNAYTAKEYTCFYARVLDEDLPMAVDVLSDMLTSSLITAEDVEAERDVILDEIAMHDDDPDDVVHDLFAEQAWAGTPLGRPIAAPPSRSGADPRRRSSATTGAATSPR